MAQEKILQQPEDSAGIAVRSLQNVNCGQVPEANHAPRP